MQKVFEYASLQAVINALFMLVFSITLFYKIMLEAEIKKLSHSPVVWFNTAILVNFAGRFFYYGFFKIILRESMDALILASKFNLLSNVLLYLFIAVGFIVAVKKSGRVKSV